MGRALQVLVIDDCCENAEALADMIRLWGHCCVVVNDGSRALAEMTALNPDVVFVELGLARLSGSEQGEHPGRPGQAGPHGHKRFFAAVASPTIVGRHSSAGHAG